MAVYIDVPLYIQYGNISQYLAALDKSKKRLFQGRALASDIPWLLEVVTESIEWKYGISPGDESLNDTCPFLYALCGRYVIEAKRILGLGQAGQVINPSTGTTVTITTPVLQFRIGDPDSLMAAGETVLTLADYPNVINPSVEIFLDGVELPYGVNDRISYTASYNTNDDEIVITFNQAVQVPQLYRIRFMQLINVGIPASLGQQTLFGGIFTGNL